jgi:hypothetical protein
MVSLDRTARYVFETSRASSLVRYHIFRPACAHGYAANEMCG